ncbi:signal recognition particle, SRP9/SRP14 subunit [Teratosphaeria nubilosa]|uniref:Signal recognition particle subunit SRP14 n=1 Tax=Teratosphaeria nubilosa TaxID=161662 RepID=A0A6G1L0S7_9PEZI|nr:signal recognition particle, SRP9/SRP14 subunit [Teratosphaeria nubilosa]
MARSHLGSDDFFTQLASLIHATQQKGHGAVYLTQKRLTFDTSASSPSPTKVQDDPLWDLHPPNPLPIIVRATDGKSQLKDRQKNKEKVKLSTIVQPDDIESFYTRYAEVCKAGMQSLKKRDRSKRKKDKGKKKGKGGAVGIDGEKKH